MKQLFEVYQPSELVQTHRIINTPSDIAKRSLFYVQETGYLKSLKTHRSERSKLASYLFLIVLSGKGIFTYQDRHYELKPSDCVLIDCVERYTHQSDDHTPWELLWVHFHGEAVKDYYEHFTKNGDNIFHLNSPEDYIDLIHQLLDLHRNKPSSWEFTSSKLITDLLIHCMEPNHRPNHTSESMNEKMHTIKQYFDQHFQEKIQLDTLAASFYVSKYHLSREFKRIFNTTVVDYLTVKRITYAKEQLRFTNKSIEEIGEACGYPDASYFNKVFRKVEVMTASDYRKKWRG